MKPEFTIYQSSEYDKFKLLLGNRSVSDSHVQEIIESIKLHGNLAIPAVINDKNEIIDGQHRYFAWFALKLPITYIIKPNLGLKEAQAMNDRSKDWTDKDFLASYLALGMDEYRTYLISNPSMNLVTQPTFCYSLAVGIWVKRGWLSAAGHSLSSD